MKRIIVKLELFALIGAICLGSTLLGHAQQSARQSQYSAKVCRVLEQFLAKTDAARSVQDKSRRAEKCAEAKKEITEALKGENAESVIAAAVEYGRLTEEIAAMDPLDPQFDTLLDKKLNIRSDLLGRCQDYTNTR
jgi:hypothetical protein